jgi:hypothetical protein
MADDKSGREKQARDTDDRQRERALSAALERGDEPEPPVDRAAVAGLESELAAVSFPATGAEVAAGVGDLAVESDEGVHTVAELVPDADAETFGSPAEVAVRVQHPTAAGAMKRIVEAADSFRRVSLSGSQRDAYEKTFRALAAIDSLDDNESIPVLADWVVEQLQDDEDLPGSRAVRRQAATIARSAGYEVSSDEWLGV